MRRRFTILLLAVIVTLVAGVPAAAQVRIARVGVVNSLKDLGIAIQTVESGSSGFNTYSLLLNLDGVITGDYPMPGAKMHWSHQEIVASRDFEDFRTFLYFGGGACAGFLRDTATKMHSNPGLMLSMTADAGVMLRYKGSIDIALEWSAEMGLHLRRDETYLDKMGLSWYANGILHSWMPYLTVYYKF